MELDTSGFATQGPTVFAGNIGDNKYIIQVSPMGIRLLEGGKMMQTMFDKSKKPKKNIVSETTSLTCRFSTMPFSHAAPLHPSGPGLPHSALLCGRPLRGYHDGGGSGHHVRAEDRLISGKDASTVSTETTDSLRK